MIARLVSLVPRNTFCTPAGQIEQQHLMSWHYKNSKSSTLFQYNVEIRIFNVEVFFYLFRMNSAECDGSSLAKKRKEKKSQKCHINSTTACLSFLSVCNGVTLLCLANHTETAQLERVQQLLCYKMQPL